ncbi:hypothetical protein E3G68_005196 [Mycobacteroides abscessus]|nr:hypothetical protein [Mycobacteroides abscessus]
MAMTLSGNIVDRRTNPYRHRSKKWWMREADNSAASNAELRQTVAQLSEALVELSAFAETMVSDCVCVCHESDEHCDTCCWPPQNGVCPDCLSYMREPIP